MNEECRMKNEELMEKIPYGILKNIKLEKVP